MNGACRRFGSATSRCSAFCQLSGATLVACWSMSRAKVLPALLNPSKRSLTHPLTHIFCNAGFVVATDPKCQFGGEDSMMVNATVKSANWIQCVSPPQSEADGGIPWARTYDVYSRAVEVSLNGVDWTTSNRAFTYYGEPLRLPWAASATLTGRPSLVRQRTRSCTSRCLSHREVRLLETPRCTMPSETAGQPHA